MSKHATRSSTATWRTTCHSKATGKPKLHDDHECHTFSYLFVPFPTSSWNFLELSPTRPYFLSNFLDFLYPPYRLLPSPTESRRRLEKVGRVERVEQVGEGVRESRRKSVKLLAEKNWKREVGVGEEVGESKRR